MGIYDCEYSIIYDDQHLGVTTALYLWNETRKKDSAIETLVTKEGKQVNTVCDCCTSYSSWKNSHKVDAVLLQSIVDEPMYYKVYPDKVIELVGKGETLKLNGTIRALPGSQLGACKKSASSTGAHPNVCSACYALVSGKTSVLRRRLLRYKKLKYPRSSLNRAAAIGVAHKFCAKKDIVKALQYHSARDKINALKITRLSKQNQS